MTKIIIKRIAREKKTLPIPLPLTTWGNMCWEWSQNMRKHAKIICAKYAQPKNHGLGGNIYLINHIKH
jgi:hypothetical protein